MYTVHGRGADLPFLLRFGQGPILVQINLQYSQAQTDAICIRVINITQSHYMWSITQRSNQYHFIFFLYNSAWVGLEPQTSRTLSGRSTTTLQSRYKKQRKQWVIITVYKSCLFSLYTVDISLSKLRNGPFLFLNLNHLFCILVYFSKITQQF